jgi:hypothetical protein
MFNYWLLPLEVSQNNSKPCCYPHSRPKYLLHQEPLPLEVVQLFYRKRSDKSAIASS